MNSANRLLAVLGLFTVERPEWTVEEAAKEIGVSVSTAYRYFRSLCNVGFLDPFSAGKYILGPAIIENDRKIRITDPLIKAGQPVMERLVSRSGSAGVALLCRIYRNCVMCIHQEATTLPENIISYERGRPMPMFRGASSKVIFASLPVRSVRWFFRRYASDIAAAGLGADWESVKASLRLIRRGGAHVTYGEVDIGRIGIAAPVFGPTGTVIGSIGMAISEAESSPQSIANISTLVEAAGREIDTALSLISSGGTAQHAALPPIYREQIDPEQSDTIGASPRA